MNSIELDKTDPDVAAALEGCELGVPIKIIVTAVPTIDDAKRFKADIEGVEYFEGGAKPAAPDESEPEGDESMPPAVRAMGRAKAVTA